MTAATQTQTIAQRAAEHLAHFEKGTRDSTSGDGKIWQLSNTASDEARQLTPICHSDNDGDTMFPDDYRYDYIVEALELLTEADPDLEIHDAAAKLADQIEPDIYTNNLYLWLSSHAYRPAYCDQAAAELGYDPDEQTTDRIARGQWYEKNFVFHTVASFILGELEAAAELA